MAKPRVNAAGGLAAMKYVMRKGGEVGSFALLQRMRSKNACKTCALGMGGAAGGMTNEAGHFPEVCKKSVQAQAADMGKGIDEAFFRNTSITELERLTSKQAEDLGRLTFPIAMKPGEDRYSRITWDEAMQLTADAFATSTPDQTFWYSSGRSSNEAAFLMQLVARAYGTNNINSCSYYCHQASGVALGEIYGGSTASIDLEDIAMTELVIVAGANPASNHPRMITQLIKLRRRGGKVIVINPIVELGLTRFRLPSDVRSFVAGSDVSDIYLTPHIGGDVHLFTALLKGVIERGGVDEAFVNNHTEQWHELKGHVEAQSWDELVRGSGIERSQIDDVVSALIAANSGIFMWAMGLTHHAHGTQNVLALGNLALARGFLGRKGSGLLPIRGHSNVQGVGSMGLSPVVKDAFAAKLEDLFNISVPRGAGQHTYASMQAAERGEVRTALMLGGNLWGSNPDSAWATSALANIETTVYLSTKLNQGHFHGRGKTTVVLPVLARDEEEQATTQESMFNYVRVSSGGTPNVSGEQRSEVAIIADLAARILPSDAMDWSTMSSHATLREAISNTVAGYEQIKDIEQPNGEFQIKGRTFHDPTFNLPGGKANFSIVELPKNELPESGYMMMTLRSEGQFNSVVYDEEDLYRGNTTRDVVMMSAADASALGAVEGQRVRVFNALGELHLKVAIVEIRDRNVALYYPEANVLVPQRIDPNSLTPAFKSVPVEIELS